ncbi:low molecular weight phosphotyrosine protein phosphatase-like isoform X3 [Daktulosphaira vitifoliae]|uniref:low molecular weight phosphotyrosine protein phosphatase-like isoform X3 n=1 Tax=Daktulosphaira vitifoliae TaxID=58002 RepID=UPI0021AAA324|nr:low molecular weight phosphotyrosine protein phosphatase-like isoform X3 [Daktulosphaira vitifoliae]
MADKHNVMFVCLGNICRSPMAEAVFKEVIKQRGIADKWYAESSGTGGWHVGCSPDQRTMAVLKKNNIEYQHTAQQLVKDDFHRKPKGSKAEVFLLGSFDPKGETIIQDPYYDSDNLGFEKCYIQCWKSCNAFLDKYNK